MPHNPFEQNKLFLKGEQETPGATVPLAGPTGPSIPGGAAGADTQTLGAPPASAPPVQTLNQTQTQVPFAFPTTGDVTQRLLSPDPIQTERTGLSQSEARFGEAAGAPRSFEGIGGADVLNQALTTGDPSQYQTLLDASYAGPQGLDYAGPPPTLQAITTVRCRRVAG